MKAFTIPYMTAKNPKCCHPGCPQIDSGSHCKLPMVLDDRGGDCNVVELYGDGMGNPVRCYLCRYLESNFGGKK